MTIKLGTILPLVLLLTACSSGQPAPGAKADAPATPKPRRIVSQTLGTDEILFAICPRDRLVGVSDLSRDPEYSTIAAEVERSGIPKVSTAEDIIRLKPDLIFIASYTRAETADLLRASHAPLFRFANFDRVDDVLANIKTVGQAIGEEAAAEALIADATRRLAAAQARIPAGQQPPRVISFSTTGTAAAGGTLFDDVIRRAGGVNLTAEKGLKGFPQLSTEQILAWQPDVIIVGGRAGSEDEVKRTLLRDPALAATRAARGGRLFVMDNRQFLTVSHHVVDAVETLIDMLYGPAAKTASAGAAVRTGAGVGRTP